MVLVDIDVDLCVVGLLDFEVGVVWIEVVFFVVVWVVWDVVFVVDFEVVVIGVDDCDVVEVGVFGVFEEVDW